jgi:hypothetical protein
MIPTQLQFARLQQTLGNRSKASAPMVQSGNARSLFTLGGGGNTPFGTPFGSDQYQALANQALANQQRQSFFDEQARKRIEQQEFMGGAGLRKSQQALTQAGMDISRAGIGDVRDAGQRAYTFGREEDELNRLRMAAEGIKLQSQMAYQPQFDTLRSTMMGRMGQRFGVSMPKPQTPYSSGTGYNPSWMRSYQTPQFPTR